MLDSDGEEVAPYDEPLTDATVGEQREWAENIAEELAETNLLKSDTTLVFHAGKTYYEKLFRLVEVKVAEIRLPTEGLAIGEALAWYTEI